jgi:competence protein ComEC
VLDPTGRSRPAVPAALAFLLGLVLEGVLPPAVAVAAATVAGLAGVGLFLLPGRRPAVVSLAVAAGLASPQIADATAQRRDATWPTAGDALQGHVVGRVLRVERTWDGEHRLTLRGDVRPSSHASFGPVKVRLRVRGASVMPPVVAGQRVRLFARLHRPRGFANPSSDDPRAWMRARGLDALGSVKSPRLIETLDAPSAAVMHGLGVARAAARSVLDRRFGTDSRLRGLLGAILIGDRAGLSPDVVRPFRDAGLSHLLAISGLHVGAVLLLLLATLRRLGARGALLVVVGGLACLVLAALVGARPPVLRATGVAGLMLLGRSLGREGGAGNTWAVVLLAIVVGAPWLAGDPAFLLSFGATGGILLLGDGLARVVPLPAPFRSGLAVSLAAYLGTAPTVAWHFGRLAPVAVPINLIGVPLGAATVLLGAGTLCFDRVPVAGDLLARATTACAGGLLRIAEVGGRLPGASYVVPPPSVPLLVVGLGLGAATLLVSLDGGRNRRALGVCLRGCLAVTIAALHLGAPPPGPGRLEAHVLDVGQGQAIRIRGRDGAAIAIDAGGSAGDRFDLGERVVVPELLRAGHRRLEALFVSHGDDDHAGGAFALLDALEIGSLRLPAGFRRNPRLAELADRAIEAGVAVTGVAGGDRARIGGIPVLVLHPDPADPSGSANARSLVLRIGEEPARLLVPGDLDGTAESALRAKADSRLRAEALVVGHHGSRHGTSPAWLAAVAPRFAMISVGRANRFGHPAPRVLDALAQRGTRTWRTDLHGRIRLVATPGGWEVTPHTSGRGEPHGEHRNGNEGEQEDRHEQQRDRPPHRIEPDRLVPDGRMPVAHPEQDEEPQRVERRLPEPHGDGHDQRGEADEREHGGRAVHAPRDRVGDVAAVELPHGKQVHRGDEQAEPTGEVGRPETDRGGRLEPGIEQQRSQQRDAADEETGDDAVGVDRPGLRQPHDHQRHRDQPARERSRGGDVEQGAAVRDGAPDPDHGTERAERPGTRDEERQGRGDPVVAAGEVVSELVAAEDQEQPAREGQAAEDHARIVDVGTEQVAGRELRSEGGGHSVHAPDDAHRSRRREQEHQGQPTPTRRPGRRQGRDGLGTRGGDERVRRGGGLQRGLRFGAAAQYRTRPPGDATCGVSSPGDGG